MVSMFEVWMRRQFWRALERAPVAERSVLGVSWGQVQERRGILRVEGLMRGSTTAMVGVRGAAGGFGLFGEGQSCDCWDLGLLLVDVCFEKTANERIEKPIFVSCWSSSVSGQCIDRNKEI